MSLSDIIQAREKRRIEKTRRYRNFDFILGSAPEVERLWSIAKYILCDNRKNHTRILFEGLLFLKVNKHHWDLELAAKAMSTSRSTKVQRKLEEDAEIFADVHLHLRGYLVFTGQDEKPCFTIGSIVQREKNSSPVVVPLTSASIQ